MTQQEHRQFVELSVEWCRVRARFYATHSKAERQQLRLLALEKEDEVRGVE